MTRIDPADAALHAATGAREAAQLTLRAVQSLVTVARAQQTPAVLEVIELSAQRPSDRSDGREAALSIGVLNPADVTVFLGIGGGSSAPTARGIPVAPASALVLPLSVDDVELGADPAELADGDAVVYLLRFATVQPFHFGAFK